MSDAFEYDEGAWLGSLRGFRIREPADEDAPVLIEFHGTDGMTAAYVDDRALVDGLMDAGAQVGIALDKYDDYNMDHE